MSEGFVFINDRPVGPGHTPYVIAELSANHNQSLDRALEIMTAAKDAGADAIKLQTYTADTMTIDHDGPGFTIEGGLWDGRTLHSLYQEAHTPWEWHEILFARGREIGVTVFSSPFDATAVDFLEQIGAPAYKVASFEIVDIPLIERIAATGKPIIISTGLATESEIGEAVSAARLVGGGAIILLHCVSSYPATPEDSDLRTIQMLADTFDTVVGLSDHTIGTAVSIAAVAMGAAVIEKHVTLQRSDGGPDAAFSLEPPEFAELCKSARTAWLSVGQARWGQTEEEEKSRQFRRSLYVVEDIPAGKKFTNKNVRSIRPGFGMPPKYLPEVIGKIAARDLKRGDPLKWEMVNMVGA